MKLLVTIDVEEEGLFSGKYLREESSASNVFELDSLDSIFLELNVRPTLLVSYQVAKKEEYLKKIFSLKDKWKAEIGAHLHHWNTPPIVFDSGPQPTPSELMSTDILEAKTSSLFKSLSDGKSIPTSFRMGRFNLGPKMFRVLERMGVKVDSSVSPLRKSYGGPDHLIAPSDPYFPNSLNPLEKGKSSVLEAPITILPIFKGVMNGIDLLSRIRVFPEKATEWLAMNVASIAVQPAWVNLNVAKTGVRLHRSRGGECVTIFFHSSELAPGMNPLNPTKEAVQAFIKRLRTFTEWLQTKYQAQSYTLSELHPVYEQYRVTLKENQKD
ncbi:MAG: hypothetical protein V1897_14050 [Pseudomonadota bacterium]